MPVNVESNVSLAACNSFGVDARAARFARVQRVEQLAELLADPGLRSLPLLVLGGGSNVLFTRDFEGLVARIEIAGVERLGELGGRHLVRVGAGENWHATVARLLVDSLAGLENLALIPGSVGRHADGLPGGSPEENDGHGLEERDDEGASGRVQGG